MDSMPEHSILGLLFVCLALMQQGLLAEVQDTTNTATSATPGAPAVTSDGKTTSQQNTTSLRNSTMAPMIHCYNDTSLNTTCSSGTGICYASITLSSGSVSLACKSLNATAVPVCASYFALTSAGGPGRCEFCCSVAVGLCNKDKTNAWMKSTCCQGQNQPACSSAASCLDVVVTTQVVVTVMSVVSTIVKTISFR